MSMLSAIVEVTEPISEPIAEPLTEKAESESKSFTAEFHGCVSQTPVVEEDDEPHVVETIQLREAHYSKSFDDEQNSIADVSEIAHDADLEKKRIEKLVDELMGGIIEFKPQDLKTRKEPESKLLIQGYNISRFRGNFLFFQKIKQYKKILCV